MCDAEEVKFSLKVMVNKEKNKVLFAEADSHFTDILLSFLTLPLGRVVKVLENHYGDETAAIGSITSLYRSLANLDSTHFWTNGAKLALLHPMSSSEDFYKGLKLDITDSQAAEYFFCHWGCCRFKSASVYYDFTEKCRVCGNCSMRKEVAKEGFEDGDYCFFTKTTSAFIISDDLQLSTYSTGLFQFFSSFGITEDMGSAKLMNVSFGASELMNLLKASFKSQTPLSDVILNKGTRQESKPEMMSSSYEVGDEESAKSKKINLKVMVQKSSGKLLYAQAEEDFVELLFSFLVIPLGRVELLLAGNTSLKTIDNLYRSVVDFIDDKYFKSRDKRRLIEPQLPHGYISEHHLLPLAEEGFHKSIQYFSSKKFPNGQGSYLNGPITYHVTDDLTVTPFSVAAVFSLLNERNIMISDVKEVEVQIGLEQALGILKASLTSTSALTNGLLNYLSADKLPKPELF